MSRSSHTMPSWATHSLTRGAAALLGFGLLVTTAGCANPVAQLVNSVTEGAVKEMTGLEDVSVSTDESGNAELPSDWPDVPTPSNNPVLTMQTADGMHATFLVTESDYDELIAEFESLGWTTEGEFDMGGQMRSTTFEHNDMVASLSAIIDESTGEYNLQYTIVNRSQQE